MTSSAPLRRAPSQQIHIPHIPDEEPRFYMRARDPAADAAMDTWIVKSFELGTPIPVIESAFKERDRIKAWPIKLLPGVDRYTDAQCRQATFEFNRRAWEARQFDLPGDATIVLAEQRGYARALADIRAEQTGVTFRAPTYNTEPPPSILRSISEILDIAEPAIAERTHGGEDMSVAAKRVDDLREHFGIMRALEVDDFQHPDAKVSDAAEALAPDPPVIIKAAPEGDHEGS